MMTASEVAKHLLQSCESLRYYKSFMFGSSLYGVGNDFDVLIVGPSGQLLSQLKAEFKLAGNELPLDVLYMLPEEEEETRFISCQACVTLAHLVDSDEQRSEITSGGGSL